MLTLAQHAHIQKGEHKSERCFSGWDSAWEIDGELSSYTGPANPSWQGIQEIMVISSASMISGPFIVQN